MQSHDELEELAAGYSLSILEGEEQRAFDEHLASCESCARLVAEMRAVADSLALAPDQREPPPNLRQRILAISREDLLTPVGQSRITTSLLGRLGTLRRPAVVISALAALLLVTIPLAILGSVGDEAPDPSPLALTRSHEAIYIMAQADRWWTLEATDSAPAVTGSFAYSTSHSAAALVAFGLPEIEPGQRYRAFTVVNGEYAPVGNMWAMDEAKWLIIRGDLLEIDAVEITLQESDESTEPGIVVAKIGF